ncbi:MAG: cytochrome c oxidase, subunit [Acidimicrobiales bacterium]|jgi:cytochrome c oxidase subunit 2|nr:cytochrome c oxidase, subunit [Acidimicrobiales bacterium]
MGVSRRRGAVALAVGIGLLMTACAKHAPQDTLKPNGPAARTIDHLYVPVFWIAAVIFVLVQGLLLVFLFKYRDRGERDERPEPVQLHGNTKLEFGWTVVPAVLLALVAAATLPTIFKLAKKPTNPINVTVVGHQFWWEYRYTDPDIGVVTANELHMPVGRDVYITEDGTLRKPDGTLDADVIHSFWVPRLNGKTDMIPGRVNHMKLKADTPGVYLGQCTEFCGLSHANMRLKAIAETPAEFDAWVQTMKKPAATPVDGDPAFAGYQLFTSRGCAGCHTVDGYTEGLVGPNLTHVYSRTSFAGALFDMSPANLSKWLRNPPGEKPGSRMPNLNLTPDEISKLVAYLETLK